MMLLLSGVAVAIVCFILYTLDRRSKGEPIAWDTAGKLSLFGGLLTSGVVFASTTELPSTVTETVKELVPDMAQDMFVGKPTF
jgi:uncharacterized membrane protein YdcZ (DUF606 family)